MQCWDRSAGSFFLLLTYFEFTENTTNYFESMLLSVVNEFDIQMPHTCIIDTHVIHINRIHSAVGGFGPRTYHERQIYFESMPHTCIIDTHVMHKNRIHSAVGGFGPRTYHERQFILKVCSCQLSTMLMNLTYKCLIHA